LWRNIKSYPVVSRYINSLCNDHTSTIPQKGAKNKGKPMPLAA
jgi:hypothetical protein